MIDRAFARSLFNRLFVSGLIIMAASVGQFLVFIALDAVRIVDTGNGLGPGLLLWLTFPLGFVLSAAGAMIALTRRK